MSDRNVPNMTKESKLAVTQVSPIQTRRSPRFAPQRDCRDTKILSPLVKTRVQKDEKEKRLENVHPNKAETESNISKTWTTESKSHRNNIEAEGKQLRRSKRVNSPRSDDKPLQIETTLSTVPDQKPNKSSPLQTVISPNRQPTKTDNIELANKTETKKSDTLNSVPPVNTLNKSLSKSTDSLQVRELRKIEDYWTRKSPLTKESPRLRSSTKDSSNLTDVPLQEDAECSTEKISSPKRNELNKEILQNNQNTTGCSLPESPVPKRISQRFKSRDIQKHDDSDVLKYSKTDTEQKDRTINQDLSPTPVKTVDYLEKTRAHSRNKVSQESEIETKRCLKDCDLIRSQSESPKREVNTRSRAQLLEKSDISSDNSVTLIDNESKEATRPTDPVSEKEKILYQDPLTEIVIKEFTDSESEDDDDYIPPRKKLRSEISTEELWEGFPSFSFKRLAPIRKSGGLEQCSSGLQNVPSTSTDKNENRNSVETSQKSTSSVYLDDKLQEKSGALETLEEYLLKELKPTNGQTDKIIDGKTVSVTLDCTSASQSPWRHASLHGDEKGFQNELVETRQENTVESQVAGVEQDTGAATIVQDTDMLKKKSVKKRKYDFSPNMTLKRSARLMQKQDHSTVKSTDLHSTDLKKCNSNENSESGITTPVSIPEQVYGNKTVSSETIESNVNESSAVSSSATIIKEKEMQSNNLHYTQLKQNKRDMSILEILTHDFNEQIASSSATVINGENKTNQMIFINDSEDTDTELDNSQESDGPPEILNSQASENKSTESVSHTLLNLLHQNTVQTKNSEIETVANTPVQHKDSPELSNDDKFDDIDTVGGSGKGKDEPQEVTVEENSGSNVLKTDPNSPNCSSKNENEHCLSIRIHKLRFKKGVPCSASSDNEEQRKTSERSNTKKSIPPLRIKLKQTSTHQKKKDLKKKKKKLLEIEHGTACGETDNPTSSQVTSMSKETKTKTSRQEVDEEVKDEKKTEKETLSKSKLKKTGSKRRKGSPGRCSMELRLNNERRQSIADEMLSNPVLDKHACVIWSSENRRHIVLSKPDASHSDIDDILRHKWDTLSDKEKLRYFQRAKNAIKDENRHSTRKHEEDPKPAEPTPSTSTDPNPSLTRFLMMNPSHQLSELKKWLHFYHEVSSNEYRNVLTAFKEDLQKEKEEKEKLQETENAKNKVNSKSKKKAKTAKQEKQTKPKQTTLFDDYDAQSRYRKLLFEKIFDVKDKVLKIWREKKEKQKEKLKDNFSGIVKKLITGDTVSFSRSVVSGRLTEVLSDIKNLETDRRLGVLGKELNSESFEDLINNIKQDLENTHPQHSTNDSESACIIGNNALHNGCQHITSQSSDGGLPQLNASSVQEVFNEISNTYPDLETYGQTRVKSSPSSMLTSWVIDDLLDDQTVQDEAQRNINNNRSQTTYTYNNREFKSILNLKDLQRKYGTKLKGGAETRVVSSGAYLQNAECRERENNSMNLKSTAPQNKFAGLSYPYIVSGSRSGIIALQHYNNGKPVVRYARVKPSAYSASQLRNVMVAQRQKVRFTPQVVYSETATATECVDEATVENNSQNHPIELPGDHTLKDRQLNDAIIAHQEKIRFTPQVRYSDMITATRCEGEVTINNKKSEFPSNQIKEEQQKDAIVVHRQKIRFTPQVRCSDMATTTNCVDELPEIQIKK